MTKIYYFVKTRHKPSSITNFKSKFPDSTIIYSVCVPANGMRTMPELWGGGVQTSDRVSHRPRLCAFPQLVFKLTNSKVSTPVTRRTYRRTNNRHIYCPPVLNIGSYLLWTLFKTNNKVRMKMTRDATIWMTTYNDNIQTRGTLKIYSVLNGLQDAQYDWIMRWWSSKPQSGNSQSLDSADYRLHF